MATIICPHCATHIPHTTAQERFWNQVDKSGPIPKHVSHLGQCWEWVGARDKKGYACFNVDGAHKGHRFSYVIAYGPIPDGYVVMHKCDNRACVRPDHLTAGPQEENVADMMRKGRKTYLKGEQHGSSKVTNDTVKAIREEYATSNITHKELGEKFGISGTNVGHVIRGDTWKHVPVHTFSLPQVVREPNVKLTEDIVKLIRDEYALGGITYTDLGKRYGITREGISLAIRGINWENSSGPVAKTHTKDDANPSAVLTKEQVRTIRAEYDTGTLVPAISSKYGVTKKTIYDVVKRRTWKDV